MKTFFYSLFKCIKTPSFEARKSPYLYRFTIEMLTFVFHIERVKDQIVYYMSNNSQDVIPLSTPVESIHLPQPLDTHGESLIMGSCFAEHIGKKLEEFLFPVILNPMGIQYNPLSIAKALDQIMNQRVYSIDDLVNHQGRYHSLMHHGDFSHADFQVVLTHVNEMMARTWNALPQIQHLVLTFGTAYVYEEKSTGEVVSNCHKLPASLFTRRRLSVDEIVDVYSDLLQRLWHVNESIQVVCTVSPVRHLRDGAHDNQLSKATLLLAIDKLKMKFPNRVHYFAAYEIVLDELRDYRFFNADMTHPSSIAVDIVWQKFRQTCISEQDIEYMDQWKHIIKQLKHRPIDVGSERHLEFLRQLRVKIERMRIQYPYLDFSKALDLCNIQ